MILTLITLSPTTNQLYGVAVHMPRTFRVECKLRVVLPQSLELEFTRALLHIEFVKIQTSLLKASACL